MSETLTVTVDDGGTHTYTVDVKGVSLFTDAGLTTPATFPVSVSADTTWYAAAPSRAGRRDNIEVVVTTSVGTRIPVETFNGLPVTVNLTEGTVDYSAPAPSTASLPDQTGNSGKVLGTDGTNPEWVANGGSSPVPADATGVTTGTLTPDPIRGSDSASWVEFPSDGTVLAWGLAGDAHPRVILCADPTRFGFVLLGDGTFDPADETAGGAQIYYGNGLWLGGGPGKPIGMGSDTNFFGNVNFGNLPTADPHVSGQAWNNAGVVTISAG